MKLNKRKIKRGVAKDYQRGAKHYDYYYIIVNKNSYTLHMNGWSDGLVIRRDENGDFVIVDGKVYYLDDSNI